MARQAAIDVGTNSVRLLVADVVGAPASPRPPRLSPRHTTRRSAPASVRRPRLRPILRRIAITRLGEGLDVGGAFRPEAVARTAAAIVEFAGLAESASVPDPIVVGTYALRVARNPEELLRRIGRPVRVLTGREEARLGYRGALAGLGASGASRVVVVDIGGGSVELTEGTPGRISAVHSLPLGCVVLTRRFLAHDPPRPADIAALRRFLTRRLGPILVGLRRHRVRLVGVGGTITTMAALAQRLAPYDADRVHGYRLSVTAVRALTANLLALPLADRRRLPGLQPGRADIIGAGALVLERLLAGVGRRSIVVSEADLLWALLLDARGGEAGSVHLPAGASARARRFEVVMPQK